MQQNALLENAFCPTGIAQLNAQVRPLETKMVVGGENDEYHLYLQSFNFL
jgi:hypothetical protein